VKRMKTGEWVLLGVIGLGGGYALWKYLQSKNAPDEQDELPADARFIQSLARGDWKGAGEALVDAAEPWGKLLSQYVFEPAGDLPLYVDTWIREHMVYPIRDWLEGDHGPDTLYATHVQTTAGGVTHGTDTRLASMR
jgi:hypothetical protein